MARTDRAETGPPREAKLQTWLQKAGDRRVGGVLHTVTELRYITLVYITSVAELLF